MEIRLRDIVENLRKRGKEEEAETYSTYFILMLNLFQGFSERRVLNMTVNELETWIRMPPKPLEYRSGWNFWWGRSALGNND